MRSLACLAALCGSLMAASLATMQSPAGAGPAQEPTAPRGLVARMLAFDKDGDGKLAKSEIADDRLLGLFDRADANKDGTATREELAALETQEAAAGRGGPGGPPGGPGRGGRMGPPPLGVVLPMMARQQLNLTADQEKRVDELQKDVDAKLAEILTDEQERQFQQMKARGPGGPGGPGGPRPKGAPPRRPPVD